MLVWKWLQEIRHLEALVWSGNRPISLRSRELDLHRKDIWNVEVVAKFLNTAQYSDSQRWRLKAFYSSYYRVDQDVKLTALHSTDHASKEPRLGSQLYRTFYVTVSAAENRLKHKRPLLYAVFTIRAINVSLRFKKPMYPGCFTSLLFSNRAVLCVVF